jgi:hypothetical protein
MEEKKLTSGDPYFCCIWLDDSLRAAFLAKI